MFFLGVDRLPEGLTASAHRLPLLPLFHNQSKLEELVDDC